MVIRPSGNARFSAFTASISSLPGKTFDGGTGLRDVRKIGLLPVRHVEEIPQDRNPLPEHPVAEKRRRGHAEILPQQIDQRRLDTGEHVHPGPQVEGLLPPHIVLPPGEELLQREQGVLVLPRRGADDDVSGLFEPLGDLLSPRNFSDARSPFAVRQQHHVAREVRPVGPAEVEEHAVAPRDRDHPHLCYDRSIRRIHHLRPFHSKMRYNAPVTTGATSDMNMYIFFDMESRVK
jgi:hypothetical protein